MTGKPVEEIAKSRISKWMTEQEFFAHLRTTGKLPLAAS